MRSIKVACLLAAIMLVGAAVYGQRLGPLVNGVDFSGSGIPAGIRIPGWARQPEAWWTTAGIP